MTNSDFTSISLKDRLRLSSIKRWHMVDTTRVQTVADHSYGVAVIAREIWRTIGAATGNDVCSQLSVLVAALDHDADEVFTGDCHNPSKLSAEDFAAKFKCCWASASMQGRIVKLADLMEARHTITQIGVGEYANAIKWSYNRCIGWAVEHFCEGLPDVAPPVAEVIRKALADKVYAVFERDCTYSLKF